LFGADGLAQHELVLEVRVHLPAVSSMKEVELDVEVEHMSLTLASGERDTMLFPAQCDPEGGVGAKWGKKTKTLTVTLPLLAKQPGAARDRLVELQRSGSNPDNSTAQAAAAIGGSAATNITAMQCTAEEEADGMAAAAGLKKLLQKASEAPDNSRTIAADLVAMKAKVEAAAAAAASPNHPGARSAENVGPTSGEELAHALDKAKTGAAAAPESVTKLAEDLKGLMKRASKSPDTDTANVEELTAMKAKIEALAAAASSAQPMTDMLDIAALSQGVAQEAAARRPTSAAELEQALDMANAGGVTPERAAEFANDLHTLSKSRLFADLSLLDSRTTGFQSFLACTLEVPRHPRGRPA
jgi:hypothetical protein